MVSKKESTTLLSGGAYDFLKFVAQIMLPAAGTLYFTLSNIWGLPSGEEIVGTIVAVDAFLGVLLGLSTVQYNNSDARYDGTLSVVETPDKKVFRFSDLTTDPEDLEGKREVTFKVNPSK